MVPVLDNLLMSHETVEAALGGFLDVCLEKGSKDNMTIMLIPLANVPQWEKVGGVMGRPVPEMIEKRIEEEEKKAKKRVRAVDSSDDEEEKRSRVEESSQKEVEDSNQEVAASIQKEVDDVFSDDD